MSDLEPEVFEKHAFHPTDPPHGMRNFDLGTLDKNQQLELNRVKSKRRIDNQIYLKAHPEVRGLISILFRYLLSKKPERDIHESVGKFFSRPRSELIADLVTYFSEVGYSDGILENLLKEVRESTSGSCEFDPSISNGFSTSSEPFL